jgi:predicted nucleic acid-binding protein
MKRVFLDATCWVAAAGRPQGGSAKILTLARLGKLKIVTTQRVLQEAERNIRDAFGAEELERFYREVADLDLEIIDDSTLEEEARWQSVTAAKDCHVLAAVFKAGADVLVTLDRKHLLTEVVAAQSPIPVMDTKQFFTALAAGDPRPLEDEPPQEQQNVKGPEEAR